MFEQTKRVHAVRRTRTKSWWRCRVVVGLVVVAFAAAACGSSAGTTETAREAGQTETSETEPSETNTDSDAVDASIPGSEEFGLTMEGLARRVESVEAAIGECMRSAGFEYIPVDFDTIRAAQAADGTLPGVGDDEFLDQYGFGITTLLDRPNAMVETAKGQNAAIVDALAAEDRVAYDRTLLGDDSEVSFVFGLEDEDFSETGGCTRLAVEQFFTAEEIAGSYVNPGDLLIDNDPRMVVAIEAWSDCVAKEGFDYDGPDDLEDDLADQLDAIVGDLDPSALAGASLAALGDLQGFERSIAPLSEDCEDEFIGPVEEAIESELYGAPQG